ncbi:hypothetical protein QWZ14_01945 [Paeniroseomonas aquatica]|uniref:Uncharacterized protein n=1 Tax=Paeniroseomonas aquatica TaxID=373043 RepID=A0ABT8A092_9PROT|nr:hypothetical protein [Paeniroseomonas aquatica]MDN3563139.1 hypothetical protein [Paeniroseomonas aquatica]
MRHEVTPSSAKFGQGAYRSRRHMVASSRLGGIAKMLSDELPSLLPQFWRPTLDCRPIPLQYLLLRHTVLCPRTAASQSIQKQGLKAIEGFCEARGWRFRCFEFQPELQQLLALSGRKQAEDTFCCLPLCAFECRFVCPHYMYRGVPSVYFDNIVDHQHLTNFSLVNSLYMLGKNKSKHSKMPRMLR